MNSRLPAQPSLVTQNSLSQILSPTKPTRSSSNLSGLGPEEKLEKLKDISSKTIDTIIFKIAEMKREKQVLQTFKDIMKISETLIEIEKILEDVGNESPLSSSLNNSSENQIAPTGSSPPKASSSSSSSTVSVSTNGGVTINLSTLQGGKELTNRDPNSTSSLEAELIQIIHSKSSSLKKKNERSVKSIESMHQIIHKCLDNIKAKIISVKKKLIFEQSVAVVLQYGEMIRNIRNQVNTFRTISLPDNVILCDGEKLLLKVDSCNYHLYDNSIQSTSEKQSEKSTSEKQSEKQSSNSSNQNNNSNNHQSCEIEDEIIAGSLFLTNYQIIFYGSTIKSEPYVKHFSLHSISKLIKNGKKKTLGEFSYRLNFICKDYRIHTISFDKQSSSLKDVRRCIETFQSQPNTLFCYLMRQEYTKLETVGLGWTIYSARDEYARMGVPSPDWRVSDANYNYFLCDSYPGLLGVPESITDEQLKSVAQFRSKGRIPILSYRHWSNKTSITRCSQPMVGIGGNRSNEDENLLNAIRMTSTATSATGGSTSTSNSKDRTLYILDARPYANAVGNRAKGAGWEILNNYPNCVLEFLNIANIHSMRHSLWKIKDAAASSIDKEDGWFAALESSGWYNHIKLVLQGATRLAKLIHLQHNNVLVHCSDGWDRTSQLVAIAELLLDPYFRTIRGFEILIEKEWLSFGHKFAQRCGQVHGKDESEQSPIFYQFLEAVYQIIHQFPSKFEFNANFLKTILHHSYSGKYGNFLFNTEKERVQNHIYGKTISLWAEIDLNIKEYLNPLYQPTSIKERDCIFPDCSIKRFKVWKQLYFNNSDLEKFDPEEKILHQMLEQQIDDRVEAFKELYPLKPRRSHTASLSFQTSPIRSSSQLTLPSYVGSNSIPTRSIIDLDNNLLEEDPNSKGKKEKKTSSRFFGKKK
ncbi:hypothetical protein DICPUDRAFT_147604 [Dictyostelium purpureum]|uniref:Myotubularin phosphatase domain-containing protein n=1 Tax=Dictyostelium purpureum TaxID=5786 RepID=F0Z8X8_DICPU|nr:uncharacterized protein DICPUDRAFT_147604 [Dictyostelium purpureum]EGC39655.1 hypothetical protein DICPUDRAFT_147604 [Dictyostelium purpureum]|eukprot:XP_003283876.1 hypothetical protein DICPUDRAFT_147604 [Dictyostelium purpureum]